MPVSVIVGGQFGSEGKGKVAKFFAEKLEAAAVVRCGGPNSGHTVINANNEAMIFQQLPTASILPEAMSVIAAGSYIDLEILNSEMSITGSSPDNLIIDPFALILTDTVLTSERNSNLKTTIGSTNSGTGAGVICRIHRDKQTVFAKDIPQLSPYIRDSKSFLQTLIEKNARIIIEGTQGFGLSLLHSPYYPFVTSRDTTAAGFCSEVGLSPFDIDDVILTTRSFPIRVPGNSGPLPNEIDWDVVTKESGSPDKIYEITSVTKSIRRVARFNEEIVNIAIQINKPTKIVLNHLDYVDYKIKNTGITKEVQKFIFDVEEKINRKIDFIGFSPKDIKSR